MELTNLYKLYNNNYKEYKLFMKDNIDNQIIFKGDCFQFPDLKKKVKPPIIKNVFEEINLLKEQRVSILLKYKDIYDNVIYSNGYKVEYNKMLEEILKIDDTIDVLIKYYYKMNEIDDVLIDKINLELKKMRAEGITTNKQIKLYLKKIDQKNKLIQEEKNIKTIDYFIEEPYEIMDIDVIKKPIIINKPKINNPPQLLRKDEEELIKINIKLLLEEKFKFKTNEECASTKRSQPYYMTKDEIIKTIESEKVFKDKMSKKYKTLKKEEICDELFY
jgi:hypothetical protein